jgi:hypothetical protein
MLCFDLVREGREGRVERRVGKVDRGEKAVS